MRKNKMMRLASALLVAVLLTTCAISGTFAKYVTEATGSDQARVAKWGFTTTSLTVDMFDGMYDTTDPATATVNGSTNVVAPGTTKKATIELVPSAQEVPEVKYHFDANISITGDADLLAQLEWQLNDGSWGTTAELQAAINAAYDKDYAPNTLPTTEIAIAWRWNYSDGSDDADTTLGNGGTATVNVVFTFIATQLD